ncbi:MAG: hypothetical protein CL840_09565 [Crocinitomicaceae bacterium]|nr:hypothetical protein [Crocinitomicaceae bacterium]|tara:strand:+ start:10522 stop:11043 length:522 start_codon:yes stop_codon:yes gene_type:complete
MNKLFFALAFVSIGFFSSCDKCKDADCKNGATCEKKVGDCNCAQFYSGTKCESQVRNSYVGKYIGTSVQSVTVGGNTDNETSPDTIEVSISGTDPSMLVVKGDGTAADPDVPVTLTSNTNYKVNATFNEGSGNVTMNGTGTFSSTTLTLNATFSGTVLGNTLTGTLTFTGTKQ